MDAAQQQLSMREVMRIPAFRRLWLVQSVSLLGDFLALFAVLSYASFKLHATAAQVTFISVAFLIPFAFFGPIAGVFVDRWDLKRTMIQAETPVEMVGRVSSSVWSLMSVAQVIGLIFSGSLAERLGIVKLFYLSAAMLAVIGAVGYFRLLAKPMQAAAAKSSETGQ